jgi:chromosome segregation ATPase
MISSHRSAGSGKSHPTRMLFLLLLLCFVGVSAMVVFLSVQKASAALHAQLTAQRAQWSGEKEHLQKLLAQKDEALALATKQNFQEELITVEAALKEANLQAGAAIRDKAAAENTSIMLDSRLKNTTSELTRTLDELKTVRETLGGIEGQYKTKLAQVVETLKSKEAEFVKLQEKLRSKESTVEMHQTQLKTSVDDLRKSQESMETLRKEVASLSKMVADKDKLLAQKQADIDRARTRPSASSGGATGVSNGPIDGMEKERTNLERQVSSASARLFDQQESLKDLETKVDSLTQEVSEKDALLTKREKEVAVYKSQAETLRQDIIALRNGSGQITEAMPYLSASQSELESRIRQLEEDKVVLEARLASSAKGKAGAVKEKDPFQDRNFRILTETLVKKEEEIRGIQEELEDLRREKQDWQLGSGPREKRLMELEILVTTLTKQLGEYAALIEKKDVELKATSQKMAELANELEAQKVASMAMQKELADARGRQEKTFQTLTQVMSMNSGPAFSQSEAPSYETDSSTVVDEAAVSPESEEVSEPPVTDAASARKRAEDLKRRVEVLLERQTDK